ncbi:bifunctional [glutamine synthetase] adenylyltransferase/[glutamine synthetase]-adenylyl-L-tyrosine phosphorylase [Protaetiibacter intestinalis]|uniref:Bifunctional [glutamine synthetase] adenylyltransferase/[glutamine synthetase]-adenylyl-L-tyrosine phosphorylase n=1 Tax=Protaetiibacter intestinalis TaxID=2419774 RepID=A0A387BB31_9MICO|nr:bifunctional [glutamine synthetase] adenylyltransferase/[glutamine synthetase]-adenylyl-L-tyrosine phosphorylase [Protaetiibacter intestinalis]AYF99597.1 bifunctional [glutamine synthetase] adenylyltransferase/[glutamine synthetase]-adenylyl-L-tyrosine phosphorylase [Protaetiibacter intestinalis]
MSRSAVTLTELARLGFSDLGGAAAALPGVPDAVVPLFSGVADPDQALRLLLGLVERAPEASGALLADEDAARRLLEVLGASEGLATFLQRHPAELAVLAEPMAEPPGPERYRAMLAESVARLSGEDARNALRIAYRRELTRLAAWDLGQEAPVDVVPRVAAALADLAGAALDAALLVARAQSRFPAEEVAATRLAIVGMGKAGARELNYVSDVDVIFVAAGDGIPDARAIEIATRLAVDTMHAIHELAVEPPLWEVDANLRPEGKDGALVRTLDSHLAYYDRWAKSWEFQALLKARPLAGDRELGERFVAGVAPKVWTASSREGFVESVQKMRERVMAHIPRDEVDVQLKLGPGGLRDVEFTIQLLQLVHGHSDPEIRQRGTLEALVALADRGYIGRVEAAGFARDYRLLRLLEHRLQLTRLRRTHLMPRGEQELRALARGSRLATTADGLVEQWRQVQQEVRSLHEKLFYRPLLSAVAGLPEDGYALTSEQAEARLAAIGFQDPRGALHHIAALTGGVSRRAAIQRALLPVMLQWFAEGADPDYGLLAFRRLSDDLGEAYWFLRMLRDSSGAAYRLSHVLAGSRFVGVLFERFPEAAAWLENDGELRPRGLEELLEETEATIARHAGDVDAAAKALRTARRREVLRLALAAIVGLVSIEELGPALADVTTAILTGALRLAHRWGDEVEFGIIAMGRYGGAELGFGSDADIMYVYRPAGCEPEVAQKRAEQIVHEIKQLTEDLRLPLDLDLGLRPEGKNGAIVRSLDSYRAYYDRWSLTWEAQALLRGRGVVGDAELLAEFERMADEVRYPAEIGADAVREVKRIKARVESERLPQGADPSRHLKLGRGSLSDVEWFVQLLQLEHAHEVPGLRTTSTLRALAAAVDAELVPAADAERLRAAWIIASRARSAMTLWTAKTADVLPTERRALEGVARLMEYPPHSATRLEEDYLRTTRIARQVFERRFYGARV